MTRIALIGLGGIAQSVHLPLLQRRHADIELVAVVDLSRNRRERVARSYGVASSFASTEELCAAVDGGFSVDAAIVATGGLHTPDVLRLVQAGVRVLSEKPLAYSHQELDRLEHGFAELGVVVEEWLMVGYMKEHDPAVVAAREALAGVEPREVRTEVLHPADASQLEFARLDSPADDIDSETLARGREAFRNELEAAVGTQSQTLRDFYSNVVLGSIVHDLALTRHLGLGLDAVDHASRWDGSFPGSVHALGRTEAGTPWTLGWHFIAGFPEYRETVTVLHERGSVTLEFQTPYILNAPTTLRLRVGGDGLESTTVSRTWPQQEAFERELLALVGMTQGRFPGGSSLDEARRDLRGAQALWRACADSAGVTVAPDAESISRA